MTSGHFNNTRLEIRVVRGNVDMSSITLEKFRGVSITGDAHTDVMLGEMVGVHDVAVNTRGDIRITRSIEADIIHLHSKYGGIVQSAESSSNTTIVLNASVVSVKARNVVMIETILTRGVLDYNDDDIDDMKSIRVHIESERHSVLVGHLFMGGAGKVVVQSKHASVDINELDLKFVKATDVASIAVEGRHDVNINLVRNFKGTVQAETKRLGVFVTLEHKLGRHVDVLIDTTKKFYARIFSTDPSPSPSLLAASKHGTVRIDSI